MAVTINIFGPGQLNICDSYGLIACQLARHLTGLGAHVNVIVAGGRDRDNVTPDVAEIVAQPIRPAFGGILLGYPTAYASRGVLAQHGPRVAVTMFESSKLPNGWVEVLNTLDAVIVPSWFCWEVFRQAGVTVPVHVVPLGVGEVYQPAPRASDRPLTFLAFLDRGKRKGGVAALQAFLRAFGDDTNYRLVLKSREPRQRVTLTNANIEMVQEDMGEDELYRLYLDCDVLINPNRGEGFGLLPREASASGCIALATNWGGTADDLHAWGWPLPYTLVEADWTGAKNLAGQDLGQWAEPDVEGVAAALRQVAAHREWYAAQALARAEQVHALYSWRRFAERVFEIWQEAAIGESERLPTFAA